MRTRTPYTILFCDLVGPTWGNGTCIKEVAMNLDRQSKAKQKIVESVRNACKDGDFQHALLAETSIVEVTIERWQGPTLIRRSRQFPITHFPSLAHFIA